MLSAEFDIESIFQHAPFAIAILGELLLISTKREVSLKGNANISSAKYLRYPHSLQASLLQISNDGWTAFHTAHVNIDQIRMRTRSLTHKVKKLHDLLLSGNLEDIERKVPAYLSFIKNYSIVSETLCQQVLEKFEIVKEEIKALNELLSVNRESIGEEARSITNSSKQIAIEAAELNKSLTEKNDLLRRSHTSFANSQVIVDDFITRMRSQLPAGIPISSVINVESEVISYIGKITADLVEFYFNGEKLKNYVETIMDARRRIDAHIKESDSLRAKYIDLLVQIAGLKYQDRSFKEITIILNEGMLRYNQKRSNNTLTGPQ